MRYRADLSSRLPVYGSRSEKGNDVLLRRSLRLKYKGKLLRVDNNPATSKKRLKLPIEVSGLQPTTYLPWEQTAESALRDYNKKNGTDLEFVRLLNGKVRDLFGPGYIIDFSESMRQWRHFNFMARRRNADPSDKPFRLFVEVYEEPTNNYNLTTLSLVKPTDKAYGCQRCWSYISHPRHGFRAGFNTKVVCQPQILSQEEAIYFAEFALKDYNGKNGTNVKFVRALKCNRFRCKGLLMDFNKKKTTWVHMNLEAKVGPREKILGLFAELYLGDDDKFVLATLSPMEPSDDEDDEWKSDYLERGCVFCPDDIHHPWRGFHFGFNCPPFDTAPDIIMKANGMKCLNI